MTTRININVYNNKLVQQNKEDQNANRYDWILKQQEEKIAAEIQQIKAEEAAQQRLINAGAVPEYKVVEETSAQREEGDFMGGWVYETKQDIVEQEWITDNTNKYRVAVGSGDGTVWRYVDLVTPLPANARDRILDQGTAAVLTYQYQLTSIGNAPTAYATVYREYEYQDTFLSEYPLSNYFLIPVDNTHAVLVGTISSRWRVIKFISLRFQSITYPEGFVVGGTYVYGPGGPFVPDNAYIPAPEGTTDYDSFFSPPTTSAVDYHIGRLDYSFLVTGNNVKRLQVSPELAELLGEIFPSPTWNGLAFTVTFWPDTDYPQALGVNFNVGNYWGATFMGAPSIFDIFDNGNNFRYFYDNDENVSAYLETPPRFAPDSILDPSDDLSTEVANIYSAFYFGAKITNRPFYNGTLFELNEYVYLKPTQREVSDYYNYSSDTAKEILAELKANPKLAFMTIKNPVGGITAVNIAENVRWAPNEGFTRKKQGFTLSSKRKLPPALFGSELTVHPLINKEPTSWAPGYEFYQFPYVITRLSTLYWTGWDRNWTAEIKRRGISLATYQEDA